MASRTLAELPRVRVVDYRCPAERGERPFEERHEAACVSFVRSGSFTYRVGTSAATLGPGAVMLGNAGESYVCSHEHAGGDRCLSVLYAPGTLENVAGGRRGRGASSFRVAAIPPLTRLGALAHALVAALRGDTACSVEEVALELAAGVLDEQGGSRSSSPGGVSARDARRAAEAMLFIDEHADEALTLDDVARVAGTSPFHFLRTFTATVGVTPHQYLIRRRLVTAAAFLLDTSAPITAIAYDVGFGDLAHFIRSFRSALGCSPRAFRRARGAAAVARSAKYRSADLAT